MPSRNKRGLNAAQNKFIRAYLNGRGSVDETLVRLEFRHTRYQKWLEEDPAFAREMERARVLRAHMVEKNPSLDAPSPIKQLNPGAFKAAADAGQPHPAPNDTAPTPARQGRTRRDEDHDDADDQENLTEREWVRRVNGEEAALAYDRLAALSAKYEQPQPRLDTPQPTAILPDSSPQAQQTHAQVPR